MKINFNNFNNDKWIRLAKTLWLLAVSGFTHAVGLVIQALDW